jgi:Domain of unknown function (DUF4936)
VDWIFDITMRSIFRRTMPRNRLVSGHHPQVCRTELARRAASGHNRWTAAGRDMAAVQTGSLRMLLNYYIYYRVAPSEAARVRAVVDAVQSALCEETGVQGSLLRRDDDASTWMEIYENVADPPSFERVLDRLLAQHRFDRCLPPDSRRHTERFTLF